MRLSTPHQGSRFGPVQKSVMITLIQILLTAISSVHPAQNDPSSNGFDDNFFSNDDDYDPFSEDPIHAAFEDGSEIWEDKCVKYGGQKALDNWLKAQEDIIWCVMENFDVTNIKDEIEREKSKGNLDGVFKKYCGVPVQKTRPCIVDFLESSRHCLQSKDKQGINVTMKMIDAAIDFVCYNSGDRIALFMAEKGMDCLTGRKEGLLSCVNKTVPELFKTVNNKLQSTYPGASRRSVDPVIVFNHENCRKGDQLRNCVEEELLKCDDPTPSNVVNAMFIAMWNSTPCKKLMGTTTGISYNGWNKASLSSSTHVGPHSWSHFLTLSLILLPSLGFSTLISNHSFRNNIGVR